MSNELKNLPKNLDKSFTNQIENKQLDFDSNGIKIKGRLQLEEKWIPVGMNEKEPIDGGTIRRGGTLTYINPDKNSSIGFFQITIGQEQEFYKQKDTGEMKKQKDISGINLTFFPRDINDFDAFKQNLDKEASENSEYKKSRWSSIEGVNKIHLEFIENNNATNTKNNGDDIQGLTIERIEQQQELKLSNNFENMTIISDNPTIRKSVCECLTKALALDFLKKEIMPKKEHPRINNNSRGGSLPSL